MGKNTVTVPLFKRVDAKDKTFWPIVAMIGDEKIQVGAINEVRESRRDKKGRLKKSVRRYIGSYDAKGLKTAFTKAGVEMTFKVPTEITAERKNPLNIPLWYEMLDALQDMTVSNGMDVKIERSRKYA